MRYLIPTIGLIFFLLAHANGQGQWEVVKEANDSINRFMVVADLHHYSPATDLTQTKLYEFTMAAIEEEVDFMFIPGDLIIRRTADTMDWDSINRDWKWMLDTLQFQNIRLFACRGNNDAYSGTAWDSLFSGIYQFPQNGPEGEKNRTYAIIYDNLLFIALDEYTSYHKINQAWLDSILATTSKKHIFAAGHEPAFHIYQTGLGIYPDDRNLFWESLTDAGAKAYFNGHAHFYDHTVIEDGDGDENNNVHQVIVGTGSYIHPDAQYNGDNGRWTPQRLFHDSINGYVLVEMNGDDATMTWKHRIAPGVFEFGGDSSIFLYEPTTIDKFELNKANTDSNRLLYCHPNPLSYNAAIGYNLTANSYVELNIVDMLGRKVATLVNEDKDPGIHEVIWNAEKIEQGIYFGILSTPQGRDVVKMVLTSGH